MLRRVVQCGLAAVVIVAVVLVAVGCGGGTTTTTAKKTAEWTVAIPFPSGAGFYPLYVAEDRGYFKEEGLSVKTEAIDGSGAVVQQVEAGQAQVGFASPGPFLQGVSQGLKLKSLYTLYQTNVFQLVTPTGSSIQKLTDLKGKTVGVGALDGGETSFTKAMLSEAGMKEGTDYKLLVVGDGGTAYAALDRNEVAAYASSFLDMAIIKLRGMQIRNLVPDKFVLFFDTTGVMKEDFLAGNTDLVKGFGRALAKATAWGMDNPEGVLAITNKYYPEEAQDAEFTLALLKETQALYALPPQANGKWGIAVPDAVGSYIDYLVQQGELKQAVDSKVFVNDYVDFYSDFDKSKL